MDFFVWLGLSRGFEQHAASLRDGLRMQAQTRLARARRRHSELWRRRATTPDGERRDLIGMFIIGNRLKSAQLPENVLAIEPTGRLSRLDGDA
jgi:hypothetical protein